MAPSGGDAMRQDDEEDVHAAVEAGVEQDASGALP
jgi:hypothetical protein